MSFLYKIILVRKNRTALRQKAWARFTAPRLAQYAHTDSSFPCVCAHLANFGILPRDQMMRSASDLGCCGCGLHLELLTLQYDQHNGTFTAGPTEEMQHCTISNRIGLPSIVLSPTSTEPEVDPIMQSASSLPTPISVDEHEQQLHVLSDKTFLIHGPRDIYCSSVAKLSSDLAKAFVENHETGCLTHSNVEAMKILDTPSMYTIHYYMNTART